MTNRAEALYEVNQGKGWTVLPTIPSDSIAKIHSSILGCFNDVLSKYNLDAYKLSKISGMSKYHLSPVANAFHDMIWPKKNRLLSNESAKEVTDIFRIFLSDIFRSFEVSDEERLGYGNIYFRLVRPYSASDVGPAHRDSWFWRILPNQIMPEGKTARYKIWTPIMISEGVNALAFYSHSQLKKNLKWETQIRGGQVKPFLIEDISSKLVVANCNNGQPILFHDDTIHKGPINTSDKTRVSIEFTLCVNKTDLL